MPEAILLPTAYKRSKNNNRIVVIVVLITVTIILAIMIMVMIGFHFPSQHAYVNEQNVRFQSWVPEANSRKSTADARSQLA